MEPETFLDISIADAVLYLQMQAMESILDDRMIGQSVYKQRCTGYHPPTGTHVRLLRRFQGDGCQRFWEMTLRFVDPATKRPLPRQNTLTGEWISTAFEGAENSLLASRSPCGGWVYRLPVDTDWRSVVKAEKTGGWLRWGEAFEAWIRGMV